MTAYPHRSERPLLPHHGEHVAEDPLGQLLLTLQRLHSGLRNQSVSE